MTERHGTNDPPAYSPDGFRLRDGDGGGDYDYRDESEHLSLVSSGVRYVKGLSGPGPPRNIVKGTGRLARQESGLPAASPALGKLSGSGARRRKGAIVPGRVRCDERDSRPDRSTV